MAITFTRTTPGTYNPATSTYSGASATTITGSAIAVRGDPERYVALSLIPSMAPTLLFTPDLYTLHSFTPEFVMPGDTVAWNGVTFTVRDVSPVAPDGVVILARIIVA